MVHGLSAQLNGGFNLISVQGEGTRAELYLPATAAREELADHVLPEMVRGVQRSRSILIVDDEELVRSGTAEMLRGLGHQVTEAAGGSEALATLSMVAGIDVVITDYKMPRMDGAELARQVRATHPTMPMLLISGYTGAGDATTNLPRLNKPFGLAELAAALHRAEEGGVG